MKTLALAAAFLSSAAAFAAPTPSAVRERVSLDAGWRFNKGEVAGAEAPAFDDRAWRALDLPHDFGIEGPFDQSYPGETGKLPWWGVAWYRRPLDLAAGDRGRQVYLDVDGAMSNATVWLNGKKVGGWPFGYASFRLDLTPFLDPRGKNVLAVRLDNPPDSSRWYPGGGIYRHVWLVKTGPVHVAHWGTSVTTPEVDAKTATIRVAVTVENKTKAAATLSLTTDVHELGADGRAATKPAVSGAPIALSVGAGAESTGTASLHLERPRLWDTRTPNLYVAVTTVKQKGAIVDRYETIFGVRSFRFDANEGFLLNGARVPIQGVCNHHDLGALGGALNERALERQLDILQAMGVNALRTSHNPPAPELLDLADRRGLLVMDEVGDAWKAAKKPNDYSTLYDEWYEKDLRAMIRRDRNHPSVILWSTGNEVKEQTLPDGAAMAARHRAIAHDADPTRPVSGAHNSGAAGYSGYQNGFDVFGYNYRTEHYARYRAANPERPLVASETSSAVSSRGEYFFPLSDDKSQGRSNFQVTSYDVASPGWGISPDGQWKALDQSPWIAGEFVWTGFDYLGEPTPYNRDSTNLLNFTDPADQARMKAELDRLGKLQVPSRSSYFGIVDLAGFPKDRFYLYQSRWRAELPMAHLLPHWTWPERVGQVTPVHVYTSGDEAELFLNGRSLGRKKKGAFEYRLRWDDVVYEPGTLAVVAYKDGKEWAKDAQKTAGNAAALTTQADRAEIRADGRDLAFITVRVVDKDGTLVPRAKDRVRFRLSGPGEIVATDNGDATSHESFQSKERNAYNGLALVIVRGRAGEAGRLVLRAEADGVAAGETTLTTTAPGPSSPSR